MAPRVKEGPIFGSMPGFEPKLLRLQPGVEVFTTVYRLSLFTLLAVNITVNKGIPVFAFEGDTA